MTVPSPRLLGSLSLLLLSPAALAVDAEACRALTGFELRTQTLEITEASWHDSRTLAPGMPGMPALTLPAHCHVEGVIDRRTGVEDVEYGIHFALNLPEDWNGRFLFQGGGGLNGTLNEPLGRQATGGQTALERGFAVASTDSGHRGMVFDASFMADQMAALNFFEQANPKVTVVARELVHDFYGSPADKHYFMGCSTGGREGMIMSQRYPEYYDGIVSGAPAMRTGLSNLANRWVAVQQNQVADRDEQGRPVPGTAFPPAQQKFIVDGLLEACDALDGAEDGMIFNTRACAASFDPHALTCAHNDDALCLSEAQADALVTGFAGPVDSRGVQVYPGFLFDPGIDDVGALPGLIAGSANPVGAPNAQMLEQDVDAEFIAATAQGAAFGDSTWLNLSTFSQQGGKLLFYHGVADPWFSALDTVEYHQNMAAANGGLASVDEWSRVFLVPGMAHCQGGDDTLDNFDMLDAIVQWVEQGQAPDRVLATGAARPDVSRPLCPYPQYAQYVGDGDPDDAASYRCEE